VTASKVFSNLVFPVTQDWKRPVRNALSRHVVGEETLQRLEVIPAQYRVMVTRRPKYACRACEQVVVQNSRMSESH
jgi:transposase